MKYFILIIILFLSLSGCRTAQQRADRHIKKAIRLDPSVIKRIETKFNFRDSIRFQTEIKIPGIDIKKTFDFSAFSRDLSDGKNLQVFDSLNIKLSAEVDSLGRLVFNLIRTPEIIRIDSLIYIEKEIIVPGQVVYVRERWKIWRYFEFWVLIAYSLFITYTTIIKKK